MNGEPVPLSREQMLDDLRQWCGNFVDRSSEWRRNSFEAQWRRWQRNSDAIYDPDIAAKKESWQSKAFVPITPSHRENAQAQLYRTEISPKPPLEIKARPGIVQQGVPGADQSDNIRDLILREREKSRYSLERNKVLEDKTTYGSGFARMRFETVMEERMVKVPDMEPVSVFDPTSVMRAMTGQRRVVDYHDEPQMVVTYRGVRFEHVSIWDIFPDPRALQINGSAIAYRYQMTYGQILAGISEGYYLPEAALRLKDRKSEDVTPDDKKVIESDRAIADSQIARTPYQVNLICYELYARLPKKWVLINGEVIDDPEKLIPARVCFHKDAVIAVELNEDYAGEPPIYKDDYMPVAGQFYGRGIPEMLKDTQLVSNETVNQRLDTGSIGLSQKFAVIEKCLVDTRDLTENRNVVRMKAPSNITDIKQLFMRLDMGVPDRSAFIEPQEWERWAQERTSITRSTLGTANQVNDSNGTLGGQQMQQEVTGDKLGYLGLLSEIDFQYDINRAFWKLIYQNYRPEDYALALGPQRAATVIPMSPEQLENAYQYYPMGVYTRENKALRQARLAAIRQQFAGLPWVNDLAFFDAELITADEDPDKFKVPESEAIQIMAKAQMIGQQIAAQAAVNRQGQNGSGMPQEQGKANEPAEGQQ